MLSKFRCYQQAKEFYLRGKALKLKGPVRDQLERASLSIALNLVEGASKPTLKDRVRFYHIALASLRESQALLDIIEEHDLFRAYDRLGAQIWRLIQNPGSPGP